MPVLQPIAAVDAGLPVDCYRPRSVVGQWLLSGDGFGHLQYGGSDLRLAKFLILFLKSAVPVLSDGGLSF